MQALVAFLKALPELVKLGAEVLEELRGFRTQIITKQLEDYKKDVNEVLTRIENAETKEERKRLARELSSRIGS